MSVKLYNGDCLEVMSKLPANSIDMVFCDLPYEVTKLHWDSIIPPDKLWEQYRRIVKPNGAICLTATQPFTTLLIASNYRDFRYCWYWQKRNVTNFVQAKKQPLRNIEDIAVFYRRLPTYNPQGVWPFNRRYLAGAKDKIFRRPLGGPKAKSGAIQEFTNYPKQTIDMPYEQSKLHPTQKPVGLIEYLVNTYTNPGDVVMDNCMGSGSAGVAATNLGRSFVGIELDKDYFKLCLERIPGAESVPVASKPARAKLNGASHQRERLSL